VHVGEDNTTAARQMTAGGEPELYTIDADTN
jgi:hypothetical protein